MVWVGLGIGPVFSGRRQQPPVNPKRVQQEIQKVQNALSPDLLNKSWREKNLLSGNKLVEHCYVAAEALFHRLGGKKAGWQSFMLNHKLWPQGCDEGETHWFLRHLSGMIADPTAGQYGEQSVEYARGKACGFLTKKPSKRAKIVLKRMNQ